MISHAQYFVSFRGLIIAVVILLNGFILSFSYINNPDLLWLLFVTLPLLFLTFYGLKSKTQLDLKKYFIEQRINAIHSNSKLWLHSDVGIKSKHDLSVTIGNDNCRQPYEASIYNIRVRDSFKKGTIQRMMTDLSETRDQRAFTEDVITYHLVGGEKILQIGPEYAGCRTEKGGFDATRFKEVARKDLVKMVELNLSPANKKIPGNISTIAIDSNTTNNISNFSTLGFTVFSDAEGMAHFIDTLRQLSKLKPVGIRICVTSKREFYQMCHAFAKTRVIPDFIVLEEAGKRPGFTESHPGMSLYEALPFVSKTLEVYGLDKNIKIIASTDIVSGFDILKILALGANAIYSDMPGYKIVKDYGNNSKETFVYKSQDIMSFHEAIINSIVRIMRSNRFNSVSDITLENLFQRLDVFFAKNQLEKYSSRKNSLSAKEIHEAELKGDYIMNKLSPENVAFDH